MLPSAPSRPAPFAALRAELAPPATPLRAAITAACRRDEQQAVRWLLTQLTPDAARQQAAQTLARQWVRSVREKRARASGVDALMHEFSLSSEEGVALMCLAEALLRIPDHQTADRLIADKISKGDWRRHLGESPSLFVNAATWGLLITGKLVGTSSEQGLGAALTRLLAKGGEPMVRKGVDLAMRMLGNQFVTGQTIAEALANSRANEARGYRYSYDMLGEAALTDGDAQKYYAAYEHAIHAIGAAAHGRGIRQGPGISVKLSALHPRYSRAQRTRVLQELLPRLKQLLLLAKRYGIGLNIDAEEADRLELSLDLVEALAHDADLAGFEGLGFVVQAYQKRCPFVIDYLADLARRSGRRFMVRLVKGAYWDAEIKRAQVDGMPGYPVYTRKAYTDVSYLVCAQRLLAAADVLYPQFATHNALTVATVCTLAQQYGVDDYEFQCLHGMGEALYDQIVEAQGVRRPCRIYAPVGSHETLLAYLVRRLLENGANSSFVNQLVDENISLNTLLADPVETARQFDGTPHPAIPLPADLYGTERRNSAGLDLADEEVLRELAAAFEALGLRQWQAEPLLAASVSGEAALLPRLPMLPKLPKLPICNPADREDIVGTVTEADDHAIAHALQAAQAYAMDWQTTPPSERAAMLERAAALFEQQRLELMALAIREAGKSLPDAVAEVREAVDFLRYYAAQVRHAPNALALGPVVCISPWNFPLAIFTGQISAALAAGNVVLAKPAEQTPLIACRAVQLLHEAGVPRGALQCLPGRGETVGAALIAHAQVRGVLFTGSTDVARLINRTLAQRAATGQHEIPLIAETGGQNAMIVDSSALPEQVVQDVLTSAFDSAGQRCSALRVLCLQADIADRLLAMLKGALQQWCIGVPDRLAVDIGPVIDAEAQQSLLRHIERLRAESSALDQLPLPDACGRGSFVAPTLIEIASLSQLQREVFGPVLHVLRYERNTLPQLVDAINATGFGLTLGIHSRIDETIDFICTHVHVGNIYVNRNLIGAVVGVQPFGGEGRSGTGPKAGGPLYLQRLQRHAAALPMKHAVPALAAGAPHAGRMPALLASLWAWAELHHHHPVVKLCRHYAETSLLHVALPLPGPTGERNTLSFAARGKVLCVATSVDALLNQVAASLACGNQVVLPEISASCLPLSLPQDVRAALLIVDAQALAQADLRLALVDAALASAWRPLLAARDGVVVPVVDTMATEPVPLWRLVAERAVCINTAAAGGNASLMTLRA